MESLFRMDGNEDGDGDYGDGEVMMTTKYMEEK